MKTLRDTFKMSMRDIAKNLGMKVGTVQNWLSGRDPNAASRQALHNATTKRQASEASPMSVTTVPKEWQVAPTASLSKDHLNRIDKAIYAALRADPSATITPADALAWARDLSMAQRQVLGRGIPQLALFWTQISRAIGAVTEPDSESESDTDDAEETE